MKEFRIIVAGSRGFSDKTLLYSTLDNIIADYPEDKIIIVSGCSRGADTLGISYANERSYEIKRFPAEWGKLGKSAGIRRNIQMAQYASDIKHSGLLVAFWDGESKGTKHMIDIAARYNLPTQVIKYEELRS